MKCFICGKELGIEPNADSTGNYPAELCEKCKADRGDGFNKMNIQRMTELCEKVKPKRYPDTNGVLPLTEKELEKAIMYDSAKSKAEKTLISLFNKKGIKLDGSDLLQLADELEIIGNTSDEADELPECIKITDPVPEFCYHITQKAIKWNRCKFVTEKTSEGETSYILLEHGGIRSFGDETYRSLDDAVKIFKSKEETE